MIKFSAKALWVAAVVLNLSMAALPQRRFALARQPASQVLSPRP